MKSSIVVLTVFCSVVSGSQAADIADQQLIHQQARQQALEAQLAPPPAEVHLSVPETGESSAFPVETPCFPITHVALAGTENFPHWLPFRRVTQQSENHCLGDKGISRLITQLQDQLINHGYVTSRVLVPPQDLRTQTLKLVMIPGKIRHIRYTPDSGKYIQRITPFPAREGKLLDLRDIEQGLENLQRFPTVQADMNIVPAEQPGESDIVLDWRQSRHWRVATYLDDTGSKSTGRYQGGLTFFLDNPLALSDLFYLSGGRDIHASAGKGSQNDTLYYSLPFGYWMASVTASHYDYTQTIAGLNQAIQYRGKSQNLAVQLSRVLHRNADQKTLLNGEIYRRTSRNFIDKTEVDVQRRETAGWKLGLSHHHFIGSATLDTRVTYQQGMRWFGAQPAPEEYRNEGTALPKITQFSATLAGPLTLFSQPFSYQTQYLRQISASPLTPQDRFSIGGRWTVRGFDGELTLSADRGWYSRNELDWQTPLKGQSLYLAMDYGEVGGRGSDALLGKHLAGSALGWRGSLKGVSYDLFVGVPLSKPAGFQTSPVTAGFNLYWQY
ncbi:ShlB/FhaC/HecB family hemolysin secretion/activation protein [Photorhabdus noenieputensis]|uniref:ShlB/FhaC/HecB family hemolysin secretion/activation protein n=1 Tax=Photorhabdus noenieputensis TaxID=1208607 RepID=UPI001BD52EDD|nr:ShlB/FhaC/HecB family hemolysin secretion/activation protein [Photorhabdus noenieputensis]MBS9438869.1 ShlB/FhaC/HecB family hemolysin secretion/activation protein [Photorhabdus noenieputensis]MCK3668821.1 ShlB/FhaC/HecB family hemolysin secretion/activation protein [Photorhabdus noenieputensis]